MKSQDARKELEARQKELAALEAERDQVGIELKALTERRNAEIRALARSGGGPEASPHRKAIIALEGEAKPLSLRLEGLTVLISEAQAGVSEAEAGLKAVEAEEHARALAAAQEKEAAECERIRAGIPRHEKRIFELYTELCLELGQYVVNQERIGRTGPAVDTDHALRLRLRDLAQGEGLALFNMPGPLATMQLWAMVKANGGAPQQGAVDLTQYVAQIKSRAQVAFLKELENG